ncbi:MAG: DUF6701 domain-containing protein [Pseudomonadota bacterium]
MDDGNGRDLTLSGNAVINGTYDATGNNGNLTMTGNGATLSGTGTIIDINRIQIDANVTIPAGSNLNLTKGSEIRVGRNGAATLTVNGTITGTGLNNGSRLIRVDNNNTSTVVINGVINAPNAFIEIQQNGTIQNNGTVSIAYLDGNGDTNVTWTQGVNSTLSLSQPTQGWNNGTFTASATGNTVNFNGTATPFNPATYYNVGGVGVACPHPAGITVLGSTPCGPGAPTVTTAAATAITAVGGTLNGTVSSNQAITTVTFQYGLTAAYGTTVTAAQSPLAANAVATPVSAAITGLTCGTLYHFRAVGSNSLGTTNGGDLTFNTAACPPVPAVVSINRISTNPTTASVNVGWQVIFNTSVTGVDASDFSLVLSGMTGSSITAVTGSGTTWTVTANTGTGTGSLGLNLVDDDTILNGIGQKLGGTGASNGNFTGQVYTVSAPVLSNVINTYYPGTASVAVGATSITLGAATGATTPIAKGDTLLILQMQDGSLNAANTDAYGDNTAGDLVGSGMTSAGGAGVYEYAIADSNVPLSGGTLTLACATINAYTNAAATGSAGQKKYQVIRVPSYASATLTSTLTASAWNGTTGGVLALDASGVLTLGGATVTLDGKGFRGGAGRNSRTGTGTNSDYRTATANLANGSKGEGIAGTPQYVFTPPATSTNTGVDGYPNGSFARGAPGNAGGGGTDRNPASNDQNSGGGGGGNGGAGGIGGIGWCPGFTTTAPDYGCGIAVLASTTNPGGGTGGFGGAAVSGLGATRLTLGGGGGAATTNDATGTLGALSSSGAAGGGIIMIRAATMSGSATFNANGSNGDSTVGNDGSGGGGAGGAVLISAGSGMAGVTINVNGGKGGDNLVPGVGGTSNPHGPGGGGGGYAITSSATAACSSAGGANGVTYQNGNPFGAYGASAGSSGSCVTGLTAGQIPGTLLGATGCGPSIDHYELSVPSSGVTCLPVTVTVTACSDNSSPCTSPITSINGETATLATDAGTLGTTTLTFNAAGTASTTLSYPAAGNGTSATVTLSGEQSAATNKRQCCPDGASCAEADSCSATFNTSGFIFSAAADGASIPSQVAGVSSAIYNLRAVKTNTTTKACESALSGTNTVNFAYECNDPTACYAANKMGVGDGTLTTIARNDNGSVSSYTSVDMTFDANGNAPFTFTYGDVGQVKLHANKDAGVTLLSALTGQSNAFVVKPYDFEVLPCAASVVGDCTAGDVPANPGVGGGGAVFAKAGASFKATVTARAFGGAATPSFGAGSDNGTEKVNLTRTRVAPTAAGAVDGTLGGTTAIPRNSFSNGIATVSDLSWSEVGVITLTASNSTFLGNTLTTTGSTGNIGRFTPDHFDTEVILAAGVPMSCPTDLTCPALYDGFVYSGQNFTLKVTAKNLNGGTTENYDNALGYEKTPSLEAWDALGSTTTQNPGGGTLAGAIAFSAGVADVSASYGLATATTAPTDIYVRAKDEDGVTSLRATSADSVEGGVKVANGRVKISNAYGSEKLPLSVPVTVQFYDGSLWQTSTTDGVTALALAASYNVVKGTSVTGTTTPTGMTAWLNGTREIQLGKPTVGGTGNATITLVTPPSYLSVINGTATFGIYKGSKEFIYLREAY